MCSACTVTAVCVNISVFPPVNSPSTTDCLLDQLALCECFAIGAHAVRRAQIRPGEQVLVIGAGPIGLGVMQFARLAGGSVLAMDISRERLDFAATQLDLDSHHRGRS